MTLWTRLYGAAAQFLGSAESRGDVRDLSAQAPEKEGSKDGLREGLGDDFSQDGFPGRIDGAGFTAALVALSAKLAKADGVVSRDEILAFREVFKAPDAAQVGIGRFFDMARQTTLGYEAYAKIIARKFRARPAALEDVMDALFHIALADGIMSPEEMTFLETVAEIFGFSDREFRRIKTAHLGRSADDPYLILGVDEDISDIDLKRAYHRMAAANHPDRLLARGLPEQLQRIANHKMAIINLAYDQILKERGLSGTRPLAPRPALQKS